MELSDFSAIRQLTTLTEEKYLFEILAERKVLKRVFIPEHGLFSELQDQIPLDSTEIYKELANNVEFISLYQNSESSLKVPKKYLKDLDVLLIDIQDTGCRYFTYISTIKYIFETISTKKAKYTNIHNRQA